MQTAPCQCGATLFFGNRSCVTCGRIAGWCDACQRITSLDDQGCCARDKCGQSLVPCANRADWDVCDRLIPADAPAGSLCRSCQLTDVTPDTSDDENVRRWGLLEKAKRRLLYDFQIQRYPHERLVAPLPLRFRFLADTAEKRILTGHADGVITVNLAEADPVHREQARQDFNEPQRTIIGHMRHESGHFFWQREIAETRLDDFRALFGDHESPSYADAMKAYYDQGPPADWQQRFISRYASWHPWEDFAETFAFYLDAMSVLDTLGNHLPVFGLAKQADLPARLEVFQRAGIVLNEVNRSLGLIDLVPEVVAPPVIEKLQFVHDAFAAVTDTAAAVDETVKKRD